MSENLAARTKQKIAKIYGAGIVGFIAFFGFLTLLALFLANLN